MPGQRAAATGRQPAIDELAQSQRKHQGGAGGQQQKQQRQRDAQAVGFEKGQQPRQGLGRALGRIDQRFAHGESVGGRGLGAWRAMAHIRSSVTPRLRIPRPDLRCIRNERRRRRLGLETINLQRFTYPETIFLTWREDRDFFNSRIFNTIGAG